MQPPRFDNAAARSTMQPPRFYNAPRLPTMPSPSFDNAAAQFHITAAPQKWSPEPLHTSISIDSTHKEEKKKDQVIK
ncbi:hypothetical protein Droror1_Dr00001715, partial [Drosera rotundifolia]